MKNGLLYYLLFFAIISQAQTTAIPDSNFEQALIDLGHDNIIDGQVLTTNISTLTALDVSNKAISSLTGIQDFTELAVLRAFSNSLTTIDVSNNLKLEELSIWDNQLSSLDVTNNTLLTSLNIYDNSFTTIDLTNNVLLESFVCVQNQITSLDLSNNTELRSVNCSSNNLSSFNVSNNTKLYALDVSLNNIQVLNVDNLHALLTLNCFDNNILALNLSNNSMLQDLVCANNEITSLDLSTSPDLTRLLCQDNLLTYLNVKNGTNSVLTTFSATNNNLSCIQVDDHSGANAGTGSYATWLTDVSVNFNEDCLGNTLTPDSNFEQALIDLGHDTGTIDGMVPTRNINTIINLNVDTENIANLSGIEAFSDLEELRCRNNQLVSLDLSNNTQLTFLRCDNNTLQNLNLKNGNNGVLTTMRAENNSLTCVEVDDEIAANAGSGSYSSWQVDSGTTFSENCSGCAEMDVIGNTISISSGDNTPDASDNTDFGIVNFGNFLERTFTIENTGTLDLNLNGNPVVEVSNSTDFTITSQPNTLVTANGGTTTFTVRYTPSMAGTINTAILSIANDDCDENPYTFYVEGQSATLGIEELELSNNVLIYPNPTNGKFTINVKNGFSIDILKIYDINGRLIKVISDLTNPENNISINELQGVYFLKIISDSKTIMKKLLVI